jgi:hypothetical protein
LGRLFVREELIWREVIWQDVRSEKKPRFMGVLWSESSQSTEFCRKLSSLGMSGSPVCGARLLALERLKRASIHARRHFLDVRDPEVLEHDQRDLTDALVVTSSVKVL